VIVDSACNRRMAELASDREAATENELQLLVRLEDLGRPLMGLPGLLIVPLLIGLAAFTEATILRPMMSAFGEGRQLVQWLTALSIVLIPSFLWKRLNRQNATASDRLDKPAVAWTLFAVVPLTVIGVAFFRMNHLLTVEGTRHGAGTLYQMLTANWWATFVAFTLLSILFCTFTTMCWDPFEQSLRVHSLRLRLHLVRRVTARIAKEVAVLEVEHEHALKLIDAMRTACRGEYLQGLATGRAEKIDVVKLGLATTGATAAAGLGGAFCAGFLTGRFGYGALAATVLSGLAGALVFSTVMLLAWPTLSREADGKPRPQQLVLPLAAAILPLLLMASCSSRQRSQAVLVLDVSDSVRATDEELQAAALGVAGRLPRCWALSVAPINSQAGESFDVEMPCEEAPYDDDLRESYAQLQLELPKHISRWRERGGLSEYARTVQFVSERLEPATDRVLVIVGDFIPDRGRASPDPSPPLPAVPKVRCPGCVGATVYLGLLPSTQLDRLKDSDRTQLLENWRSLFRESGVDDGKIILREFGLKGLEAFSSRRWPAANPVFAEWRSGVPRMETKGRVDQ
jgi:hypothetical protein